MLSAVATAIPSAAPVAVSSVPTPVAVDTENAAAAAADQDMLSMIIHGYSDDPWFATASHTGSLDVFQGLFLTSKNPSCKNCMVLTTQGTLAITGLFTASTECTGGLAWLLRYVNMSRVARPAKKANLCKHTLQANLCLFQSPNSPGIM